MLHTPVLCHRLFFALRPPIVLARQIASAAHWFENGRGVLAPERLHVTMDILDDLAEPDGDLIQRLLAAGAAVAAAPFEIVFDRVGGSAKSIALRPSRKNARLDALRAALVRERGAQGIAERNGYAFSAHMTLGYRKGAPFNERIAPVAWPVDGFELIHSHLGQTRYDVLGRWTVAGAAERQLDLF
jgi:2'-5' RNA ligase